MRRGKFYDFCYFLSYCPIWECCLGPSQGAVQMPADSARFSWMAVRTAADGAAGALETFVYLSCFLPPVFKLAGIAWLW